MDLNEAIDRKEALEMWQERALPSHLAYELLVTQWVVGNGGDLGHDPYRRTTSATNDPRVRRRLPRGCPAWLSVVDPLTGVGSPELAQAVVDDLHRRIRLGPQSGIFFLRDDYFIAPILRRDWGFGTECSHGRLGLSAFFSNGTKPRPTITTDGRPLYGEYLLPKEQLFRPGRLINRDPRGTVTCRPCCQWGIAEYPALPPPPPPGPFTLDRLDYPWESQLVYAGFKTDRTAYDVLGDRYLINAHGGPEWCEAVNVCRYLRTFGTLVLPYFVERPPGPETSVAMMWNRVCGAMGARGNIYSHVSDDHCAITITAKECCDNSVLLTSSKTYAQFMYGQCCGDIQARRAYHWTSLPHMPWNTPATMNVDVGSATYRATRGLMERFGLLGRTRTARTEFIDRLASAEAAQAAAKDFLLLIGVYGVHFFNITTDGDVLRITCREWCIDPLPDLAALSKFAGSPLPDERIADSRLERPVIPRTWYETTLGSERGAEIFARHGYQPPTHLAGYPIAACIIDRPYTGMVLTHPFQGRGEY